MSKQAPDEAGVPEEYMLDLTKGPDNVQETPTQQGGQLQEEELPEKYRGKSPKEIVQMHQNAESELGRARNEIGQVRRLADELLGINSARAARAAPEAPTRTKLTPDSILSDPEAAVVSVVKEEAEQRAAADGDRLARLEYELSLARFERKHPEYQDRLSDPAFTAWIQKSPLRTRLAQATVSGDFASADELFSLYEEVQAGAQSQDNQQPPSQTEQVRRAGLARSGGSSAAGVTNTNSGKPVWSRAKLMEMRLNNPTEFERLQPQILQAYAEKRVK